MRDLYPVLKPAPSNDGNFKIERVLTGYADEEETIAIILKGRGDGDGCHHRIGQYFVNKALSVGYYVQVLVDDPKILNADVEKNDVLHENLYIVRDVKNDPKKMEEVVCGASYVICLVEKRSTNENLMLDMVKKLIPIMNRNKSEVFFYQADYYSRVPGKFRNPVNLIKNRKGKEHNAAIKYIVENVKIDFIIARPGDLIEKIDITQQRNKKTTSYDDFTDFTIHAIKDAKFYGNFPKV